MSLPKDINDRQHRKFRDTASGVAVAVVGSDGTDIGNIYNDIRFDADDSQPNYIGLNVTNGAATSDTDWVIWKFTYSGSNATRIQRATGAWDNRASLF